MGLATVRAFCVCAAAASTIAKPPLHYHFLPTFSFQKNYKLNLQKSIQHAANSKLSCSLLNVETDINDEACELVSGEELSLEDDHDNIHAYLFKAVKNNNGIGLLLLSDIYGFQDSFTRDFAYRVACNGFNILVPDLFRGDPWTKDQPNTLFEQWIARHNPERIATDITAWTEWMADEFMTSEDSRKLSILGFCFGGGKLLEVLARDQGDNDPFCAVSEIENIHTKIDTSSKVVIFPGRGHGFAHRPGSPEEDKDAEKAYVIMRDWIYQHLVV
ncbi:unnamed protein product [Vicia faba]|uniref:Carboxymethylenebutenolidase homolog n=1 Tax=Vicia faba TaxID=3906 RepID=A0AAV0ZD51_VICFA|nr:unnamed protein product [Vicia faba]